MPEVLPSPTEAEPLEPEPRVKAPYQLRAVYGDLYQADRVPNEDRATILDGLSGGRPWDEGEAQIMGRPDLINFNWGEGEAQLNAQISLYNRLLQGAPWIARFVLRSDLKITPDAKAMYEDILAEEFHKLNVRRWPRWFWTNLQLLREYVTFGVAFGYFGDDMDWRWHPAGLNHVKIQRMQKFFGADCTEVAFTQQDWTAADLVAPLRDGDKAAIAQGWDADALKRAINYIRQRTGFQNNLEQFIHEIKNNELFYRSGRAATISVLYSFVEEFDGMISWYIMTEDAATTGSNKDDNFEAFLFKRLNAFKTAKEVFIPHCMAVSTGELHSVRGLGWKIFEPDVQRNRANCMMLTNLLEAGSPMFQAQSEEAEENFEIFRYGGSTVIPPGMTYIDRKVENLAPNLGMASALMQKISENVAGVIFDRGTSPTGGEETATQFKGVTDNNIVINDSERLNFLESRGWIYQAQWNRIKVAKKTYPGGSDALEMLKRCRERGVPQHIIDNGVDYVEPMVSMIAPGQGVSTDDQIQAMTQVMDKLQPQGRNMVLRALVGHMAGWQNADAIIPASGNFGPDPQAQMAILENGIFSGGGGPLPVLVNQDHLAHAIQHAIVGNNMEGMAAQALNTRDNETMAKAIKNFGDFVHHYMGHTGYLAQMPVMPPEAPQLIKLGKNWLNAFTQLSKAIDKIILANQRNEAGNPGNPQGDPNAGHDITDAQVKMMKANQEMAITQQQADQEAQIKQNRADQILESSKIKTAQKIQMNDLVASSKMAGTVAQHAPPPVEAAPSEAGVPTPPNPVNPNAASGALGF